MFIRIRVACALYFSFFLSLYRSPRPFVLPVGTYGMMMYTDQMLDSRLTLREACMTCVSTMGLVAIWDGGGRANNKLLDVNASAATPGGLATIVTRAEAGAHLAVGDDAMGHSEFARAIYHCGNIKSWDGMCPVSQVGHRCVQIHQRTPEILGCFHLTPWW